VSATIGNKRPTAEDGRHAARPPAGGRGLGRIQIGTPVSLGRVASADVLVLAAAGAPTGSRDPVDLALLGDTTAYYQERSMPPVEVVTFDAAVPDRRYSLTRVRGLQHPDGRRDEDLVVMRGDLRAVARATRLGPDRHLLLRRNASHAARYGYRPLAVASAPVTADGLPGRFEVHGFVPVRTASARGFRSDVTTRTQEWVRVPVWPATLRWLHWLNVLAIVVLTVTGFYIADPILDAGTGQDAGFLMGWMRLGHFVAAYAWVTMGLIRVYMLFLSRNPYVRWPALWPLKNKEDVRNLRRTISAYLLVHPHEAPTYIAHNPLQQLAYTGIYLLAAAEAATGFALYGLYHNDVWFWALLQWPVNLLGASTVRLVHYLIMLVFWAFLVLHIYLAVRADTLERHGGISSMSNGGVWLRKGSHPVDDPNL